MGGAPVAEVRGIRDIIVRGVPIAQESREPRWGICEHIELSVACYHYSTHRPGGQVVRLRPGICRR
jgi:hypothetical protein